MTRGDDKATVLIVHGTFSATRAGTPAPWYAPHQPFSERLDERLAARGSAARCWRHLGAGEAHFSWDGANDWLSRAKAASRLRAQIRALIRQGWTVHLVGHSHGGNVIIDAITDDHGWVEPWFRGKVALLGTPLYQDSPAFARRREALARTWVWWSLPGWALLLAAAAARVDLLAAFRAGSATEYVAFFVGLAVVVFAIVLGVRLLNRALASSPAWLYYRFKLRLTPPPARGETRTLPFLMINSADDEAYRSLSGLPVGHNPLTDADAHDRVSAWTAVRSVAESSRSSLVDLIESALDTRRVGLLAVLGLMAMVLPLLFPWLWTRLSNGAPVAGPSFAFWIAIMTVLLLACLFDRFLALPGIVLRETPGAAWRGLLGVFVVRFDRPIKDAVWDFMKALGFGLSGAPRRVQDVMVRRAFDDEGPEQCVYLELPDAIVSRVKEEQRSRVDDVLKVLYRKDVTWSPERLRQELEAIGFPLVHTRYYDEPECLDKIADWMCEPLEKEYDGRVTHQVTATHGAASGGLQNATIEEMESSNSYRWRLERLKEKYGPAGSQWGTGTNFDGLWHGRGSRGRRE